MIGYTNSVSDEIVKDRINRYNIDISHFSGQKGTTPIKRTFENVFCENSTASQRTLREWFLKGNYVNYECSICGNQGIWNDRPLTLILDHINGNHKDNKLKNLYDYRLNDLKLKEINFWPLEFIFLFFFLNLSLLKSIS